MMVDLFLWLSLVVGIVGFLFGTIALYVCKDIARSVREDLRQSDIRYTDLQIELRQSRERWEESRNRWHELNERMQAQEVRTHALAPVFPTPPSHTQRLLEELRLSQQAAMIHSSPPTTFIIEKEEAVKYSVHSGKEEDPHEMAP